MDEAGGLLSARGGVAAVRLPPGCTVVGMVRIGCPTVAVPAHFIDRSQTVAYLERLFEGSGAGCYIARLVNGTRVERRYLVAPPEHLINLRSVRERAEEYQQAAVRIAADSLGRCVHGANLAFGDIDFLVTVSTTGFVVPWLDAYLVSELGMRRDIKRMPAAAGGCSGAMAALRVAADYVRSNDGVAAVVAVEVPSLCLQPRDCRRENVIASALFGDGAGACLVSRADGGWGLELLGTRTYLVPDTTEHMRVLMGDGGISMVLSREVPLLIRRHLRSPVEVFLAENQMRLADLAFYIVHPGGPRVIEAAEVALGLDNGELWASWEVLRSVGNTSSASIFFVMREILTARPPKEGELGLVIGVGPGLSFELMLVKRPQVRAFRSDAAKR